MDRLGTRAKVSPKPAWRWLYAAAALALAPFALVATLVPQGALRTALELVAALALGGVLARWVRANRIEIELQGRRDGGWRQATVAMATPSPPGLCPPDLPVLSQRRERAASAGHSLDGQDLGHARFVTAPRG